jgi:cytochrome c2
MKNFVIILLFTSVTSIIYTSVGYLLPQLENHPPPLVALGADIGPEELSPIGAGVFEGNCKQCHKMGESGRAPDLANVGAVAASRAAERAGKTGKSYTDVDYLLESLCKPGDHLVEGFGNIMPPQGKALTGGQLLAVVAFLQNLGGEATVRGTMVDPVKRFDCVQAGGDGAAPGGGGGGAKVALGSAEEIFEQFGCSGCHAAEGSERKLGPPLGDAGKRLSKGELYESLLAPDAVIAPGDPPYAGGVMKTTLDGNGFYEKMTPGDYQKLVDWLAAKKG